MLLNQASERGGANTAHGLGPHRKPRQHILKSGLAAALRRRKDDQERGKDKKIMRVREHNP